jgi:hypothetical protein
MPTPNPLSDLTTLRDIAARVGSYFTAYSLATAGAFGDPIAVVGRTQLYRRSIVEPAVATYLAKRALRSGRGK